MYCICNNIYYSAVYVITYTIVQYKQTYRKTSIEQYMNKLIVTHICFPKFFFSFLNKGGIIKGGRLL